MGSNIDFDTLPSSQNDDTQNSVVTQTVPDVTIADIEDYISPKLYSELSWDDNRSSEEVTQSCIDSAKILAETLLHVVNQKLNLYSDTQKFIVKNLTIYSLYLYNGDRYRASEYLKRAEHLISDRFGSLEAQRVQKPSCAAVSVAKRGRL